LENKYLREFLNVFWLRPESAMWRTIDCMKLDGIEFKSPIIDVGCGDGIFSFIRACGEFGIGHDMFLSVDHNNIDIYDSSSKNECDITKAPNYYIDVGLDHKQNLLDKATNTHLYKKLIRYDVNQKLPFDDGEFETIFCNMLYWIDYCGDALMEFQRIISKNGSIVLMLPDTKLKEYYVYNQYLNKGSKWAKLIDGGRYSHVKHCHNYREWANMFNCAGLKIVHHDMLLSERLIKFWDVGLRPISRLLIKMSNAIDNREELKREWIDTLYPICESFVDEDLKRQQNTYHLFVLVRK